MENLPNRKLPVIEILGTQFYADAIKTALTEVGNPGNRIYLLEMTHFEDHHECLYDIEKKNVYHGDWVNPEKPEIIECVWIRPIMAIDPEGMNYLVSTGAYPRQSLYELAQPLINIAGIEFYVDDVSNRFREKDNRWNTISFDDVIQGERCGFYFDKKVKNVPFQYELDRNQPPAKLPEHIVFAEVPEGKALSKMISDAKQRYQQRTDGHKQKNKRQQRGRRLKM